MELKSWINNNFKFKEAFNNMYYIFIKFCKKFFNLKLIINFLI